MNTTEGNINQVEQRARDEMEMLDGEISRKQRMISERQKFIELLEHEISDLKGRKASIQFIVSGTRPQDPAKVDELQERLPFNKNAAPIKGFNGAGNPSLKRWVQDLIWAEPARGHSVADLCEKLKMEGFEATENFYQVVYSACIRLTSDHRAHVERRDVDKSCLLYTSRCV